MQNRFYQSTGVNLAVAASEASKFTAGFIIGAYCSYQGFTHANYLAENDRQMEAFALSFAISFAISAAGGFTLGVAKIILKNNDYDIKKCYPGLFSPPDVGAAIPSQEHVVRKLN